MDPKERISNWKLHDSQRGHFSFELYKAMAANDKIFLVVADLGYAVFDSHRADFPDRFLNCGASEQCGLGICVGLRLQGYIPFFYSITTFLLFRGFEWIRNFLHHEGIAVRLVGSGLDDDYNHDGITHQPWECKEVLKLFPKITARFPTDKNQIPQAVRAMVVCDEPSFICLRR